MIKKLADGSAKAAEELEAAKKEAGEGERFRVATIACQ